MNYRIFAPELVQSQLDILDVIRRFAGATVDTIDNIIESEAASQELLKREFPGESSWIEMKDAIRYLVMAGFLTARWIKSELTGGGNPDRELRSAKNNAEQAREILEALGSERPSIKSMLDARASIESIKVIKEGLAALESIGAIQLPISVSTGDWKRPMFEQEAADDPEIVERPVVLSVLLYLEKELWANPQIIKPNFQYKIKGEIQLNAWPEGYNKLSLLPVSTNDDSWYTLSIQEVKPFLGTKEIAGTLIFKHAQANFEDHWSVKLLAILESPGAPALYPEIVGYDELRVKVLSESSFPMLSRYPSLNEKIWRTLSDIDTIMPKLPAQEREDFALLLSGILNFQGHCAERGTFKGVSDLTEHQFRDRLMDFLDADYRLTSPIIKEGELAGGKVEINYKGIIAELKVEKHQSDREKIIEEHWRQAAAYGSSAGKNLSILCVLDLVEKTRPSATATNNVFLKEPIFHGFEHTKPGAPSRIVVVFIDGNLRKPSTL